MRPSAACGPDHDERNGTSVDAVRVPGRAGGERGGPLQIAASGDFMSGPSTLPLFQPATMTSAQLAAGTYLARYSGRTQACTPTNCAVVRVVRKQRARRLAGIQPAHVELYIRQLGDRGLMDTSVNMMVHAVRGYFRSPTSTAPSAPTRPYTHDCRRSTATSPAPKDWTGSS